MKLFWTILILLLASIDFSHNISLELSANVDDDVCPGVDVVYTCIADESYVLWTAVPCFTQFLVNPTSFVNAVANVALKPVPFTNPFRSTLTITNSDALNFTEVVCAAESEQKNMTYRRILDLPTIPPLNLKFMSSSTFIHGGRLLAVKWNWSLDAMGYMLSCENDMCERKMFNNSMNTALLTAFTKTEVTIILTGFFRCFNTTDRVAGGQASESQGPATSTALSTGVIAGIVGGCLLLILVSVIITVLLIVYNKCAGKNFFRRYKLTNTNTAEMSEYVVTSHTGTARNDFSPRTDTSAGSLMAEYAVTSHTGTARGPSTRTDASGAEYAITSHTGTNRTDRVEAEYAVMSHTCTTHGASSRTDPLESEYAVISHTGTSHSPSTRRGLPGALHSQLEHGRAKVVPPTGDEYSLIQHDQMPLNRHDVQASGQQYSLLDTKENGHQYSILENKVGDKAARKPLGVCDDLGENLMHNTISNTMLDSKVVYSDVNCKAKGSDVPLKPFEADASLDLNMLLLQVADVVHLWERYGAVMGVPLYMLTEIGTMEAGDHDKMVEVMDHWFLHHPKNPPPSWREISKGLKDIGCDKLAADIKEVYNSGQLPIQVDNTVELGGLADLESPPPIPPKLDESDIPVSPFPAHSPAGPPIPEKIMAEPGIPALPPKQVPALALKHPAPPPWPAKK